MIDTDKKDLFLRFCRWALPLLGVSAVISCDGDGSGSDDTCVPMYGAVVAEYGIQLVEYRVSGKVVDPEKHPIPNILVGDEYSDNHVLTEDDGTFVFESEAVIFNSALMKFQDLDGEKNGGEFQTKYQEIPLLQATPGDGMSDPGDYEAVGVEVVLEKK